MNLCMPWTVERVAYCPVGLVDEVCRANGTHARGLPLRFYMAGGEVGVQSCRDRDPASGGGLTVPESAPAGDSIRTLATPAGHE